MRVDSLPLPKNLVNSLASAGFTEVEELTGLDVPALVRRADISNKAADQVISIVKENFQVDKGLASLGTNALELLRQERESMPIVTFSYNFDNLLGGGIPRGAVTELCGVPGIGKSQLCMQIAVDCCIPKAFAGVQGGCIYIDTEGGFSVQRIDAMAGALVKHLRKVANHRKEDESLAAGVAEISSPDEVLKNVHVLRAFDLVELTSAIYNLDSLIHKIRADDKLLDIRAVVVDSVAFPFRLENAALASVSSKQRLLAETARQLHAVARENDVAVIVTNHTTTRLAGESATRLTPALGETWLHSVTNRILMYFGRTDGSEEAEPPQKQQEQQQQQQQPQRGSFKRIARVLKSTTTPAGRAAAFFVTGEGFRDQLRK